MRSHALQPAKRELDTYACKRPLQRISVRRITVADVAPLFRQAEAAISGGLAKVEHVSRIIEHNGECIWVVDRRLAGSSKTTVGFHAFLPLSPEGEAALLCATFAFLQPDVRHIATAGEEPAALYWWASYGTGTSATAITQIMGHLKTPRYRCLDIYSRPATRHGARALLNVGFRPLSGAADPIGSLVIYRRLVNRAHPVQSPLN